MNVLHIRIRNDGTPPHRETVFHKHSTHVEAVQEALAIVEKLDDGEWARDLISRLLSEGRAIWVWEWKKKGNGDYVQIVPLMNDTIDMVNYITNIDFHDSVILDEIRWIVDSP